MEPLLEDPTATGQDSGVNEDWRTRIEKLEKMVEQERLEKKGIYKDLKAAERKAQELEARMNQPRSSTASHDSEDPASFINDVNARGRAPIIETVQKQMQPLIDAEIMTQKMISKERALRWMAKQESIRHNKIVDEDDVEENLVPKILETAKTHGLLNSMDWENGSKAAYKILLSEEKQKERDKEEEETRREKAISEGQTEAILGRIQTVPVSKGNVFSRTQVSEMLKRINVANPSEQDKRTLAEIKLASEEGRIR